MLQPFVLLLVVTFALLMLFDLLGQCDPLLILVVVSLDVVRQLKLHLIDLLVI